MFWTRVNKADSYQKRRSKALKSPRFEKHKQTNRKPQSHLYFFQKEFQGEINGVSVVTIYSW